MREGEEGISIALIFNTRHNIRFLILRTVDSMDTGYSREPGGGGVSGAGHWSGVPPAGPLLGLLHM